jgi:hypothetical protein
VIRPSPAAVDDEPEIEVLPTLDAAAAEPPAGARAEEVDDTKGKQGWVSSLLSRLSRGQKR